MEDYKSVRVKQREKDAESWRLRKKQALSNKKSRPIDTGDYIFQPYIYYGDS